MQQTVTIFLEVKICFISQSLEFKKLQRGYIQSTACAAFENSVRQQWKTRSIKDLKIFCSRKTIRIVEWAVAQVDIFG